MTKAHASPATHTVQELAQKLRRMEAARRVPGQAKKSFPEKTCPRKSCHGIYSTGIESVDRLLPGGGFREGTLVEWLGETASGVSQFALVAARPTLSGGKTLIVVDLEQTFYPPAAAGLGIDLRRLIAVRPVNLADALWAIEQSLQSPGVGVTFCRLERLGDRVFRRLQLAAERGQGLGFLIRPPSARGQPSWSDVRLSVEPVCAESSSSGRRWRIEVLRCRRGGADGQRAVLLEYDDATSVVYPASERVPASPAPKTRRA
jgi:hypothetical protein